MSELHSSDILRDPRPAILCLAACFRTLLQALTANVKEQTRYQVEEVASNLAAGCVDASGRCSSATAVLMQLESTSTPQNGLKQEERKPTTVVVRLP